MAHTQGENAGGFERVEALFHAVLERPGERARLLAEAAERDPALADRAAALLAAHEGLDDAFLTPAAPRSEVPDLTDRRIAGFRLRRVLGSGGMGVVYEAEQERPRRRVALKVVHVLPGRERELARFRFEADVTARLAHPSIAQVFEAGTLKEAGGTLAWLAMELVEEGRSLRRYVEEERLDLDARLELFAQACRAVHHGHANGVLHRDLKPDNVLVGRDGRVRVIDFGVARALGGNGEGGTATDAPRTRPGALVGTPSYMSPEQLSGEAADIRSDVFGLGVMLFELVVGERPWGDSGTGSGTGTGAGRREPRAPSAVRPGLAGELDTIVMTALEAEPARRYATVAALLEDLRRFRGSEPILARPPGALRRVRLYIRRHRAWVVAGALLAAVLLGATLLSARFAWRAERSLSLRERGEYVARLAAAAGALRVHDTGEVRLQLERAPEALRGWEWDYLAGRAEMSSLAVPWPNAMVLQGTLASDGGRIAVTASGPETLRIYNTEDGSLVHEIARGDGDLLTCCAFAPDAARLFAGAKGGRLRLFDLADAGLDLGESQRWVARTLRSEVWSAAFAPGGREIAVGYTSGEVHLISALDGAVVRELPRHEGWAFSARFDSTGEFLYTGSGEGPALVRRFDLAAGVEVARGEGHGSNVESLALSPDGDLLASGSMDGTVRLWDARTLEALGVLRGHDGGIKSVAFSPDGRTLASGSLDNTVRLWSVPERSELACFVGHATDVRAVGFRADGGLVSFDRSMFRAWDAGRQGALELVGLPRGAADLAFLEDGGVVATSRRGEVAHWGDEAELLRAPVQREPESHGNEFLERYMLSADNRTLFGLRDDWSVVAIDVHSGETETLAEIEWGASLALLPAEAEGAAERELIIAATTDTVHRLRLDGSGEPPTSWPTGREANPTCIAVEADGRHLLIGYLGGRVERRTLAGELVSGRELEVDPRALAIAPEGARVAVGGADGGILLLDAETLATEAELRGHSEALHDLAWSPDGRRLASASTDGTVRLWQPEWAEQLLVLRGFPLHAQALAWSDDGRRLAAGGGDWFPEACHVLVWSADPER